MQSAPPEDFQTATSIETIPDNQSSSQHGIQQHYSEHISDSHLSGCGVRDPPTGPDEADNASVASSVGSRGRKSYTRRLSSRAASEESYPGSRIDAYERANVTPRKLSDGVVFQVIPSVAGKQSNVSILDFPNEVLTHVLSHLPPETLSLMSLVNRRFHKLITTPHAWRIAFARYFPGSESMGDDHVVPQSDIQELHRSHKRIFTRVSALASWRSEYILRTRLLRSLGRGRPALQSNLQSASRSKTTATAVVTYGSNLHYPVSHLHATFGVGLNKKQPLYIHGAVEQGAVSTSDPATGKIGGWGLADFEAFKHFADLFIGDAEYGLGSGEVVGMPNVMDISQPYGKLYGEACPGGRLFYTSTAEQRGRFLVIASAAQHERGIPEVSMGGCAVTAVWLAKSDAVLKFSGGLFGCLAGFANGVLCAFAIGVNPIYDRRYDKGEPTAKWVLCPGVPIVAISIDEKVSLKRSGRHRIWITVLNALGEVYYLTDLPSRPEHRGKLSQAESDYMAWETGRSVQWNLIEATRRAAKVDPFETSTEDGSYSPKTSSNAAGLSSEQLTAEAREIEKFIRYKPKHFQAICDGWDMRRRLVVDYGGDDHHGGGESVFIINCGWQEDSPASIRRFTRKRLKVNVDYSLDPYPAISAAPNPEAGISYRSDPSNVISSPAPESVPRSRASSNEDVGDFLFHNAWYSSTFALGQFRAVQITAVATDNSDFATPTAYEDPLLGMSGGSETSSPLASPLGPTPFAKSASDIPGQRARLLAIGSTVGTVLLWDMRASTAATPDVINTVQPVRLISTKSPQISSLALTSLYVVHGGNDGLVQAWDPLASTTEPLRTLNSRFSDRARRRIAQAEASMHGVGHNFYAAGAIVLDPDPTVLRGMVSLGTQLRFWSYSAAAADAYKNRKRGQLRRRSDRGSTSIANDQKYHHTGRGVLKDYIADEKLELEREKVVRRKEHDRLVNRFGTKLLGEGASEEELLAYATMLSEEAYASDQVKRDGDVDLAQATSASAAEKSSSDQAIDADLEEAIRLSLLDTEVATSSPQRTDFDVPIRYAKSSKHGTPSKQASRSQGNKPEPTEDDDLEFALQLSMAEQESKRALEEDFPTLSEVISSGSDSGRKGKGKDKGKARR